MRQELAALVVHDLKNALGILEAQLDSLQHEPDPALARRAHRQCADMRQRFITFLTLYGADGKIAAHCADESPHDFLASLLKRVARPEGAVRLRLAACDGAPAFWYFDFRLVRMALESALHNAWHYAHSQILLGVREEAGCLVFSVEDDGPGLGGDSASGVAADSTGLGLELCKAVARAHGAPGRPGRATLCNRAEGGARFELWLA